MRLPWRKEVIEAPPTQEEQYIEHRIRATKDTAQQFQDTAAQAMQLAKRAGIMSVPKPVSLIKIMKVHG